jgi:tRNA (adenine-N(1)-)-methyltransferase non-catalytic subunit
MDTLAQMLNLSNIRPGGRYLVVDDASGLVVSAILEKMGGTNVYSTTRLSSEISSGCGRLISICDIDGPPAYPIVHQMNFKKETVSAVLRSLNWSTAHKNYIPGKHIKSRLLFLVADTLQSFRIFWTLQCGDQVRKAKIPYK